MKWGIIYPVKDHKDFLINIQIPKTPVVKCKNFGRIWKDLGKLLLNFGNGKELERKAVQMEY